MMTRYRALLARVTAALCVGVSLISFAQAGPDTSDNPIRVGGRSPVLILAPISGRGSPSPEVADLVADTSKWSAGARHVKYISVASQWLSFHREEDVIRLLKGLAANHIGLEVGSGILIPGSCGSGEGFNGEDLVVAATTIKRHGGTIDRVSIDESFSVAAYASGANACHYSPEQVATLGSTTIAKVKSIFPQVIFGAVEPMPADHPTWLLDYEGWAK